MSVNVHSQLTNSSGIPIGILLRFAPPPATFFVANFALPNMVDDDTLFGLLKPESPKGPYDVTISDTLTTKGASMTRSYEDVLVGKEAVRK
jgi:hypothetical protein